MANHLTTTSDEPAMAEHPGTPPSNSSGYKKGFIARFRRHRDHKTKPHEKREQTPSPTSQPTTPTSSLDRLDHQSAAASPHSVFEVNTPTGHKLPARRRITLDKAPTAREAAFGGPPRYDWVDIETSAAIKVQAAFRRNQVMSQLEREGRTTAAVRNRARRRRVRQHLKENNAGGLSQLLTCCGLQFLGMDDGNREYEEVMRAQQKEEYAAKKKAREAKEESLRHNFMKNYRAQKKADGVEEAYEVIDEKEQNEDEDLVLSPSEGSI